MNGHARELNTYTKFIVNHDLYSRGKRGIVIMAGDMESTKRILNCIPSRERHRDWGFENAMDAEISKPPTEIPPAVNLHAGWWKIRDQGNHGACVGFATADSLLRWHFVKKNQLQENEPLSVRFIWMSAKETDQFDEWPTTFLENQGTSLKAALDVTRKMGCVTESMLPFDPERLYNGNRETFYASASKYKIANYFSLRKSTEDWETVQNNWRTWLAMHGPILTRLNVDATWFEASKTNGNLDAYKPDTVSGGHAVALVGYTKDRFIVRNSWGTKWGYEGFGFASLEYAEAAFKETYGITIPAELRSEETYERQ